MTTKLAWGIIGTGGIAKTFAKGILGSKTGTLVAVGSRTQESADKFGSDFLPEETKKLVKRHASYEALLADPAVQAVYISTPHPLHAEWAIKAAEAGKHILCEKPLTLNWADSTAVVAAAKKHDVFLMEAFMYRCHPATKKIVELVKEKAIGELRAIQANFAFHWPRPYNTDSRLTNNKLGGGGILDVGCYCTSLARLVAGVALGKDFAEPLEVKAVGHLGADKVDEWAFAVLKFPNDIIATLGTGVQLGMDNTIKLYGSDGNITVPWLWIPNEKGNKITVNRDGKPAEELVIDADAGVYSLEADTVAQYLDQRQSPTMSWADTLGNMKTLDRWRAELGAVYEAEKAVNRVNTVANRPLAVSNDAAMPYGKFDGVSKPVSRLIFGVDKVNQGTTPLAFVNFDDYFERGGNTFDTAHIYWGGGCERVFGDWVERRNIREKIVIIGKGAHTPNCNPEGLRRQLDESLERLQTNYVDIYMMHRDNPEIPVGEFVEVLNEQKKAGRMNAFGGSNWLPERFDAFNAYAKQKGLTGMIGICNNFSLARMVEAPWTGCISASTPEVRAWLTKTQTTLFAWSSQARGFFTNRANPNDRSDHDLVHCWYSDDNFQRQARAKEMAKKKNTTPIVIALAYVLNQPFPTFPLIGPYCIEETAGSFEALKVKLTSDEVKWLNLES